jgi:thiamine biosynthesis lipoprotein
VDLAVARLRQLGIEDAIVNAGGDLRAIGRRGERPWRIAVRKPAGGVIGAVEVRGDEALFTSGNYERFRLDREERYPHILDPRTGWPVEGIVSATVITSEGVLADAAATALVVAGLEEWPQVARAFGLDQVLIIDESGTVYMTADMAARVRFTGEVEQVIIGD